MYQCIVLHHLRVPGVPGLLGEVVRVEGVRIGVVGGVAVDPRNRERYHVVRPDRRGIQ